MHEKKWISVIFISTGGLIICLDLFLPYSAVKDPYSWTQAENIAFYAISRIAYACACAGLLLAVFLGNFNIGKIFFLNNYFRVIGKLTFGAALIYPIVIMLFYGRT